MASTVSACLATPKIDKNLSIKQIETQYSTQYVGEMEVPFFYGKELMWCFLKPSDDLSLHAFEFCVPQHPDDKQVCAAIVSAFTEAKVIERIFKLKEQTPKINI